MHGVLDLGGSKIFFSDAGGNLVVTNGNSVKVSLAFTSQEAIDNAFAALSEGGTITMALQDTFWGARFGMCTDKFGINWMCNWDKPKE